MSETAPDEWEDVVETLRHDLDTVADEDADEEDVSAAIEGAWSIVDAFEARVGDVDVEGMADVLGVDPDATEDGGDGLDVASIPAPFVADDPGRAATLARLVSLIGLDEATDYDVGRLWEGGHEGESDGGEGDTSDGGDGDSSTGSDAAEELRSQLAGSIAEFRERVEEARGGLVDSGGSGEGTYDEAGGSTDGSRSEDGGRSTSSAGPGSSGRSNASATAFSTVPSNRHDLGRTTGLSTVPGRRGRSGSSSRRTSTGDGDGEDQADERSEDRDEE